MQKRTSEQRKVAIEIRASNKFRKNADHSHILFVYLFTFGWSRDSVVSRVTRYEMDGPGFES